jgi:hypothetical protein
MGVPEYPHEVYMPNIIKIYFKELIEPTVRILQADLQKLFGPNVTKLFLVYLNIIGSYWGCHQNFNKSSEIKFSFIINGSKFQSGITHQTCLLLQIFIEAVLVEFLNTF